MIDAIVHHKRLAVIDFFPLYKHDLNVTQVVFVPDV